MDADRTGEHVGYESSTGELQGRDQGYRDGQREAHQAHQARQITVISAL
jgi:hypothetical protein